MMLLSGFFFGIAAGLVLGRMITARERDAIRDLTQANTGVDGG
jgi:hypothetical protein